MLDVTIFVTPPLHHLCKISVSLNAECSQHKKIINHDQKYFEIKSFQ